MSRPPTIFAETLKQARRMFDELYSEAYLNGKIVGIDSEFVPITHEPVLVSFSWGRGIRRVVRAEIFKEVFGEWAVDPQTKLAYQNYKEDVETFEMLGFDASDLVKSFYIDTMVAGVLRDETLTHHGLKAQMLHWLKWSRREYKQTFCYVPSGKKMPIVMSPRQVMDDLPPDALLGAVTKWGTAKGGHKTGPRTREDWHQVMIDYAGDDAEGTAILGVDHRRYLRKTGYWDSYVNVDRPFTVTLMQCEQSGALIDQLTLEKILRKQEVRIMRAEHCFRIAAGNPTLNLRSPIQMRKLLMDEWNWPPHPDNVSEKTGESSMDKEVLKWWSEKHKLELADVKLAFNNAQTLKGTFLLGILKGIDSDGRLRSDLNQVGGKTSGRISSRKFKVMIEKTQTYKNGRVKTWVKEENVGANLQNIPARKEKDPDGIRGAFRAPLIGENTAWGIKATESHKLIVCDYSGFHLVLVANFVADMAADSSVWAANGTWGQRAGHSAMVDVMNKYGSPSAVHVYTTIQMFKHTKPHYCDSSSPACIDKKTSSWKKHHGPNKSYSLEEFTMDDWGMVKPIFPDQYTYSKNTNFALLFLGSPWTLAYNTGRDASDDAVIEECKQHYDDWYGLYPEIKIYQQNMIDHAYEHGYVPTIGHRRGHVRKMLEGYDKRGQYIRDDDKRKQMVKHGERVATNIPAQGGESDVVKMAMNLLRTNKRLIELRCAPLFPVHDEVVCESPESTSVEALPIQIAVMKEPYKDLLKVPLSVEGAIGDNWLSGKP